MTALQGKSLLGASLAQRAITTFHGVNAATGEPLEPPFHAATSSDVDAAAALAIDAFAVYGRLSGREKGGFLRRIAENLEAMRDVLVARASLETALPAARMHSELGRTCGQLVLFAQLVEEGSWVDARIDRADPDRKPLPKPDVRSMLRPLGPVAVFGASNFPLAFSVAGGDTASALAAGCPVIVKAHPSHPGTSELAGHAIRDAVRERRLPEGTFSLLFDGGYEVGIALVRHPAIRAVGFTGSRKGGFAIMQAAAERNVPIPVYAEMGSVNPFIVLPGAMRERGAEIAAGLHAAVTMGVGQFCTNPGLVIVDDSDASERFLHELQEKMAATAPAAMLNGGICSAYHEGLATVAAIPGVDMRTKPSAADTRSATPALFVTGESAFLADSRLHAELFGPATLVVRCSSPAGMREVLRLLEGQLTVTVHGTDEDFVAHQELLPLLESLAGRIVFNGYPTGVEVGPAIVHGGPYPATSDGRSTSVGTRAIERFTRPFAWQNAPRSLLPEELRDVGAARIEN
ncbi:MAG TPA: aldehyde dehydrogenase (NADP(+)) [Thermoanaerobaculia bacterium]